MSAAKLAQLEAENQRLQAELTETREALAACQSQTVRGAADIATTMSKLLEVLPAGVVIIDGRGVVQLHNPAAENLLGLPLVGLLWREVIQRSFAPQDDDGHEVSLRDGRRLGIATTPLAGLGQLVLLTDLTSTRLLQGRLAQAQRLTEMGRMMASLAHQIRTPLSAALLYASNLATPTLDDQQRQRFANKLRGRLTNIEQQIGDMLIFARGETRCEDLLSSAQLLLALEEALDVPLAQFDADCDIVNLAESAQIRCNKEALIGAMLNVVNNALQAIAAEPMLNIAAKVEGHWLVVTIEDNGPGMDQQTLDQVMQPFFTTKSHGTGLGLSVAQVVAKGHQGAFELSSQLGEGTRGEFWLPLA